MASYNLGKVVGDDGVSLEYNWEGTSLGIKREDEEEYTYVDLKGDKGDAGSTGASGSDGYSPTVSTSKEGKTTTIEITDKNGTHTATINDGADGSNGTDGISPTANVSKSGNTATITITDKNGTTTTSVSDGVNGTDGRDGYVQYTAGSNINIDNNVISADLSSKQDIIQYSTMPIASSSNVDKIVQYIGTDTNDYTNGYFYKCVEDNGTYSWENVKVQQSGGNVTNVVKKLPVVFQTTYISDEDVYNDFQEIIDYYISHNSNISPLMTGDGYIFYKLVQDDVSSTNNYRKWMMHFYKLDNSLYTYYTLAFYTTYTAPYVVYKYNEGHNARMFGPYLTRYVVQADLSNYIAKNNTTTYTPTGNYNPATKKYVDDSVNPTITEDSSTTNYTITSLIGNQSYKLGELTSLTITATTTFDRESVIYFTSGTTPTDISIPDTIVNLGDAPTMTASNGVNTGTCEASKSYIISILNNIAVWKAY